MHPGAWLFPITEICEPIIPKFNIMKFAGAIAGTLFPFLVSAQKIDSASVSRLPVAQQEEVNNYFIQAKETKNAALFFLIGERNFICGRNSSRYNYHCKR